LLLAILLGPHAAFLVMASVLIVQALFFADGGLLALGCNMFNLGFFPAFIAYPLYRALADRGSNPARAAMAAMVAALLSLQLGALAVVLESVTSGISALPLGTFVLFMLPIHLGIGLVEGLVTATVVAYLRKARPEILRSAAAGRLAVPGLTLAFLVAAVALGGFGAWFASKDPDGLEWSIAKVTGTAEPASPRTAMHDTLSRLQAQLAFLPDYGFHPAAAEPVVDALAREGRASAANERLGTSVAGLVGGAMTLVLALLIGWVLTRLARRR
jgi:cobalt/nickel transport system permease protein